MSDGVKEAIKLAGGGDEPRGRKVIAELIGTSLPFIYKCENKGFFPPDHAKKIATTYPQLKLVDLVAPKLRSLVS